MKKTLLAILLATILITGCQGGPSVEEKLEKSNEVMQEEQIEPTEKDTAIIEEVVKDEKVEYAYVTHHEETVMLKIKFTGEADNETISKYMDKLTEEYPDKNINIGIIPNEEE